MRQFGLVAAAVVLTAGPALAQLPSSQTPAPLPQASPAPMATQPGAAASERRRPVRQPRRAAADRGANNPNAAFMGGGAILEGAPGAPAPAPQAITTQPGPDGVIRMGPARAN